MDLITNFEEHFERGVQSPPCIEMFAADEITGKGVQGVRYAGVKSRQGYYVPIRLDNPELLRLLYERGFEVNVPREAPWLPGDLVPAKLIQGLETRRKSDGRTLATPTTALGNATLFPQLDRYTDYWLRGGTTEFQIRQIAGVGRNGEISIRQFDDYLLKGDCQADPIRVVHVLDCRRESLF